MKTFREYLAEAKVEKDAINESDSAILKIKLEDGDMVVKSTQIDNKSNGSEKFEHIITYNGMKTTFITNDDYEAVEVKGQMLDALTLFNHLIQQFYIDGTVKSK